LRLYRTKQGIIVENRAQFYQLLETDWDRLLGYDHLAQVLTSITRQLTPLTTLSLESEVLAPICAQEVWAAGVTYFRSRTARMEEAKEAGGDDFYDRVYVAARPELFFKATPHRVAGHLHPVRIRRDSRWNVPEPELALALNPAGKIIGYTIGNDMSSRDIEGENPLYLPQAKIYAQSCALGPGILITDEPLPGETEIRLEILRAGEEVYNGQTQLSAMKRTPQELVEYLFRDNSFPQGCFLLTGTGIVPPDSFTLQAGDEVRITIEPIGTLINRVQSG
jgi:2-dehydro-3-deoxy-D-arabinonate dehydratase